MTFESTTIVRRASGQAACRLDGEVAILNLDRGVYFGLQDVGALIWEKLESPVSVDDICAEIHAQFEVEPARCRADVVQFLASLRDEGLLDVVA